MAKPTANTKWSLTGTKVEPSSPQKDAGWSVGQKPPAQWLNWWMDAVDQWVKWLEAFESTAHTWTATQTFAVITAQGSGSTPAVEGTSGSTTGAYGVSGVGANGGTLGKNGTKGIGGTGSVAGGAGLGGLGGAGNGVDSIGGTGVGGFGGAGGTTGTGTGGSGGEFTGGAIDGTTNTTGAAGRGVRAIGGAVSSDADNRKGGTAVEATGGLGQLGYGAALRAVHGDVEILDGSIVQSGLGLPGLNQLLDSQVTGDLEVTDDMIVGDTLSVTGAISANGGITLEARTEVFGGVGFQNSWADATSIGSERVSFRKDAFGIVHMEGAMKGGTSGNIAFTLPAGYRPLKQQQITVKDYSTSNVKFIEIATNGDVTPRFASAGQDAPTFDSVTFATT